MAAYSVNEVIEFAVQIEKNGYAFYHEASKRKDLDAKAREFIEFLRDQELNHEKTFLALRDDADMQNLELTQDWELVAEYLKTIVSGRIFNSEDSAIKKAAVAKDLKEIIDHAITFEKDTLLYFHAVNDNVSQDKAKQALRRIINEEVSHVLKLNDYRKTLS
ncbi:MAG: ferritin family protein [Candidatus Cloacimonetes bacterium]|jgi:rubrerythrin|nr:ferritin family protein [Candidatus Cloacimonadota bacterium]MDY0337618.1 ferritin family protein [Candidatus Cloacimonadaceae bacterium]MCK9334119.1 ferritin family protein [Candidatus Cloacimonadota bacterium]MDD2543594.1 ferritin family protein [Candidatus Cloacimonadota bacterium]MDD2682858.1 ferritin family protein [Candidatus Cloacimonadota bacterium]